MLHLALSVFNFIKRVAAALFVIKVRTVTPGTCTAIFNYFPIRSHASILHSIFFRNFAAQITVDRSVAVAV